MTSSGRLIWVLETDVFADRHEGLQGAAESAGQEVVTWDDLWWSNGAWPRLPNRFVMFHGSLGNADRVKAELPWKPGAFCDTAAFSCSNWYRQVPEMLLNRRHSFTTVRSFTEDSERYFAELDSADRLFVRPDSALKPFSGRLVERGEVSPAKLDHGFYYDDLELPIVLAPARTVQREWRLVVANGQPIAGSSYTAESRQGQQDEIPAEVQRYAQDAARHIDVGDRIYVLDICETDEGLRILELNPFSGADLYFCDRDRIVEAVAGVLRG